jgi:hypothetical protein
MLVVLSGSKVGTVGSVSIIDTQLRLVNVTANNNTAGPWLSFGVLTLDFSCMSRSGATRHRMSPPCPLVLWKFGSNVCM